MRRSIWITTGWIAIMLAMVIAIAAVAQPAAPAMATSGQPAPATATNAAPQAVCIQWTHTAGLRFYRHDNTRIDGDARERTVTVTSNSGTGPSNRQFFTNADYGMNYSRWRDEQGNLHGSGSSGNSWGFITPWTSTCSETVTQATYTVTHVQVDGNRDSAQAVKDANKTPSGTSSGHHEFTLDADATNAEILAKADALSTHSITTGSRYIDAGGEVHNFHSGKRTYWLITKSEVNVVVPDPDPDRQNATGNLTLTGSIADQVLTKGVAYTSAAAFPEATGIDGTVTYSVASLPAGITLNSDRKLTGTATTAKAETEFTYTATDVGPDDTDTATLTFKLSVVLVDYDADDDGLIEVADLAQLNAIRWDLDGNGAVASGSDTTNYTAAFPNALAGMGCNEDAANDADKVCIGYELTADLDFDTNGDGVTNVTGDTYWNAGKGWTPIGVFTAEFDGDGHNISNLFINADSGITGLFSAIGAAGEVRNVGLIDVDVSSSAVASGPPVGALAGESSGDVSFCYVAEGTVAHTGDGNAGGLVGNLKATGSVTTSWSSAAVSATGGRSAGGLVGLLSPLSGSPSIADSYATGAVTQTGTGRAGGLVGVAYFGTVDDSYATGVVTHTGTGMAGGLVGESNASTVTVTTGYWDTNTSGTSDSGGGVGKTSSQLQTPTAAAGIYADWGAHWDFVDTAHYPLLKAAWDDTGGATWQEFGEQDPEPAFADGAAIADIELTRGVLHTGATAFPEATDGNGENTYSVAGLPDGISLLNAERKISGKPTAALVKKSFTYKVTDTDDGADTISFNLSVAPQATTLTGSPGNGVAHLGWTAIYDVTGWEYLQNEKDATSNTTWATITGNGVATAGHKVTGLDNSKEYDFKVRAFFETGGARVNGVESNKATVDVADQTPALSGAIADQILTQGTAYTSAAAFPAAAGGDAPLTYLVASLPSGIELDSEFKLTGTATAPLAKTSLTYKVTDAEGDPANANDDDTRDTATLTFNIGVAPMKPDNFSATAGDACVYLVWKSISGVSGWQVKQDGGSWTAIANSGEGATDHTVTGLTNDTAYTFKVRAVVGSGNAQVAGVESDPDTATPAESPFNGVITDKVYIQDQEELVFERFPSATPADPDNTQFTGMRYYISPEPPSGIVFDPVPPSYGWAGFPDTPMPVTTYYYGVREKGGDYTAITFTVSVRPKKPEGFTAAAGAGQAALGWTAIPGVTGWEYSQDGGSWTAISGSGAATTGHTVTNP